MNKDDVKRMNQVEIAVFIALQYRYERRTFDGMFLHRIP